MMRFFVTLIVLFLGCICSCAWALSGNNDIPVKPYTLVDEKKYQDILKNSDAEIADLLSKLNEERGNTVQDPLEKEKELRLILQQFLSRPYGFIGVQGEGAWPVLTKEGKVEREHLQQDPVYRTDLFNCATLVEITLALMNANTLQDFQKKIIQVNYGAAQLPVGSEVRYCNRNNFTSKDLNSVNQQQHYIQDITTQMPFSVETQKITAWIDPEKWFAQQAKDLKALQKNLRVFSDETGKKMVKRLQSHYVQQYCPALKAQHATLPYIPKQALVKKEGKEYVPQQALLQQIPTPAIVEIVRDDDYWRSTGQPIQEKIGTGIIVSHLGLLYKAHFEEGELIYQQITCQKVWGQMICKVNPVVCDKKRCDRLMFAHATDAYPKGYFYYKTRKGWVCQPDKPAKASTPYTLCNRVVAVPFGDYLAQKQDGRYIYMDNPALLGVNIEKIISPISQPQRVSS